CGVLAGARQARHTPVRCQDSQECCPDTSAAQMVVADTLVHRAAAAAFPMAIPNHKPYVPRASRHRHGPQYREKQVRRGEATLAVVLTQQPVEHLAAVL